MIKCIQVALTTIITLTVGNFCANLDSNLSKNQDTSPDSKAVMSWSSNFQIIRHTKMRSTQNLHSNATKKVQSLENVIIVNSIIYSNTKIFYNNLQNSNRVYKKQSVFSNARLKTYPVQYSDKNWDSNPKHMTKKWDTQIKSDTNYFDINDEQYVQNKQTSIPRVNNINLVHNNSSSILDTIRNYHDSIGIPLAELIRQAENNPGKNKGKSKNGNHARIAGGNDADLGQFPFIAGLKVTLRNNKKSICGASLVSSNRLVTAGHCWQDSKYTAKSVMVILGSLSVFFTGNIKMTTNDVVVHPKFDIEQVVNDIAIIRLKTRVTITRNIQVINLPTSNMLKESFENYNSFVAGYGKIRNKNAIDSTVRLGYKQVKVINNKKCAKYYGDDPIEPTILCAGTSGGSTCKGDSGGPLAIKKNKKYYLIGVTSFGPTECESSVPSGFTRVTSYVNWIKSQL